MASDNEVDAKVVLGVDDQTEAPLATAVTQQPRGGKVPVTDGVTDKPTSIFAHDFLTSDLTRSELIEALEMLPLRRAGSTAVVVIDHGVARYLVGALRCGCRS